MRNKGEKFHYLRLCFEEFKGDVERPIWDCEELNNNWIIKD